MAEIRPEEISAILREQLSQSRTDAELEEVGTVLTVGDGVARIYGLTQAQAGALLYFLDGPRAVVPKLGGGNAWVFLFGDCPQIKEDAIWKRTGTNGCFKVWEG